MSASTSFFSLYLIALVLHNNQSGAVTHNIETTSYGSAIDSNKYYIERMFQVYYSTILVPLKYRLHVIEDSNSSIAGYCLNLILHESSCELLRDYVRNNMLKEQTVACSVPFGQIQLDFEWNKHFDGDLKPHLERVCHGMSREKHIDAQNCFDVAFTAMTQQIKMLKEHYEATNTLSLQQMGIWLNMKGLDIVDPFLYFKDPYGNLPTAEERLYNPPPNTNPARILARPSLHILIATTGRPHIFGMLASLSDLETTDFVTIVFDGFNDEDFIKAVIMYADRILLCTVFTFIEYPVALGFFGHGVRNRYNQLQGDFVMHVDDDDIVLPGSIEKIKSTCTNTNIVYIFRMRNKDSSSVVWNSKNKLRLGDIGTPCGVIPTWINAMGRWGLTYGGDFMFYTSIVPHADEVIFVDFFTYLYPKMF